MGFKTCVFIVVVITQHLVIASQKIERLEKIIKAGFEMEKWNRENDISTLIGRIEGLETTLNVTIDRVLGVRIDNSDVDLQYINTYLKDLNSNMDYLRTGVHQEKATVRKLKRSLSEFAGTYQQSLTKQSENQQQVVSLINSLDTKISSVLHNVEERITNLEQSVMSKAKGVSRVEDRLNIMEVTITETFDNLAVKYQECLAGQSENQQHVEGLIKTLVANVNSVQGKVEDRIAELEKFVDTRFESITQALSRNGMLASAQRQTEDNLARIESIVIDQLNTPTSCHSLLKAGYTRSGVYWIRIMSRKDPIQVFCDQETDGGGWTVFQRRRDGSVDFYRNWNDYKAGFGDMEGDFWLGNDVIHEMTTNMCCRELRVDLKDRDDVSKYAAYTNFSISSERDDYSISVAGYSGTAGDSLGKHNGMKFSTRGHDNDLHEDGGLPCAEYFEGAWWFRSCYWSHLNGEYLNKGQQGKRTNSGIVWRAWHTEDYYSLPFSEMKFR